MQHFGSFFGRDEDELEAVSFYQAIGILWVLLARDRGARINVELFIIWKKGAFGERHFIQMGPESVPACPEVFSRSIANDAVRK